jgi:hypothetical protein
MTSISVTSGSNYLSPLQLLSNELQTEVNSGAISSSDQGALSSALTDINSSLQGGNSSNSSNPTSGTSASPGDLQSKINALIAGEVSSGKLTSDQATELQGVFAAAFANGPGGAADSTGASNAGAPGGGIAPAGPAGSTGSSDASTANDILQQFLQSLQTSLSNSSSSSYSATGSSNTANSGSSAFSALLVNYQT